MPVARAVPVLETDRFLLTVPPLDAAARLRAYAEDNEPHLARWEPPRPEGYFTLDFWRRRIAQNHDDHAKGSAVRFTIVARAERGDAEGAVLGHCNLNEIVRGCFQACYLGFSVDHRWEGKGVMREALGAVIPFAFGPLGLHRIMANHLPTNERSGGLLRRLGFVVEGYARDYLFIGGAWRDHVLTSLTNPTPLAPPPVR